MAQVIPDGWRALEVAGQARREIETLHRLAAGLPDDLVVFHGVHWTRIERGFAVIGEIDFVIVGPSGRLLLIEQKSGFLSETPEGLVKTYGSGDKRVAPQLKRSIEALSQRLAQLLKGDPLRLDYLLYCPDYRVRDAGSAGVPPERIVDASQRDRLCARIIAAFPAEPARDLLAGRLRKFFADELQLTRDVSALIGRAEQLVTRVAGGLATWGRRLSFEPFRLRVTGAAGSGKTQLALAVLEDAAAAGRRARYVCFNRPLADHLARLVPAGVEVTSFHQLCDRRLREEGEPIDYARPGEFEALARRYAELPAAAADRVDELVIDEGQDFEPDWADALLARLAPGGRAWWLEDPLQKLYDRPAVALPGWVALRDDSNYRSPRSLVRQLARLVPQAAGTVAASPLEGSDLQIVDYADDGVAEATLHALTLAHRAGYRASDIAIVTFRGRARSALAATEAIGPHRLRRFGGGYDLLGHPQYTDGDVLIETVYRFKGQSAPCVILTEIDFDAFDPQTERKLFVGMTRASLQLILVMSRRAAGLALARLEAGDAG